MPLLLPNLDDRKWAELVDESRALIPVYGPAWTDHNASDPGITLIEMLAWIAEMDIYELNQISDRERLKFLELIGVTPKPPLPAKTTVQIRLKGGTPPLKLPAGVEFQGQDSSSSAVRFRTLREITLVPGTLNALQFSNGTVFRDLTSAWRRENPVNPFGETAQIGTEFYIGLSNALPADTSVQFFLTFDGGHSGTDERERFFREACARTKDCLPSPHACTKGAVEPCHCGGPTSQPASDHPTRQNHDPEQEARLPHHGVRIVWEYLGLAAGSQQWIPINPSTREVDDGTRAFTLDGHLTFKLPVEGAMAAGQVGAVPTSLYYLRCRIVAGSYDATPILRDIAFNGVRTEQSVPSGMSFLIDPSATIIYGPNGAPKSNDVTPIKLLLDDKKKVVELRFDGDPKTDPEFLVYDYREPKGAAAGVLAIEGVFLDFGNGFPNQQFKLPDAPVEQSSFRLHTLEAGRWQTWHLRHSFDASTRKDSHFLLDPAAGTITFGTGEKGRVPWEIRSRKPLPREQCLIIAQYRATRADAGNLAAGSVRDLADSPHNRALYGATAVGDGWTAVKNQLQNITNPLAATGGTAAETVAHASGRADLLVESSDRAVTLADYEKLALQTPGTQIARVSARANLHPSFPCFKAPGMITVIVLPFLPHGRPLPSPGLLQAVRSYLRRRRIVGTRVEVVAPIYLEIAVQAEVRAQAGTNRSNLQQAVVKALNAFLDPLLGGPDGTGWPFGRDVYRPEILRVINEVPGVDYIAQLELIGPDGQPQCGNICLNPTWLVAAGAHQITVL